MITIAVANQKGGVGKTTIAFNLSHILANAHQQKVLTVEAKAALKQDVKLEKMMENNYLISI